MGNTEASAHTDEHNKKNLRELFWILLVMGTIFGAVEGLGGFTWGAYLYEQFGGSVDSERAMLLSTIIGGVIFSVFGALFEMPAGALADALGRAYIVMQSWVFRCLASSLLSILWLIDSLSWRFSMAVIYIICFTISYTLFNGAFSAWLADWLKKKLPQVHYAWASSRFQMYRAIAKIFGAVFAILVYVKGYAYTAYVLSAFLSLIAMGFSAVYLKDIGTLKKTHTEEGEKIPLLKRMAEIFTRGCRVSFKIPIIFWTLMTYGFYMFLFNMVKYLWPVHLEAEWGMQQFAWEWVALVVLPLTLNIFSARYLAWKSKTWVNGDEKHVGLLQFVYLAAGFCAAGVILTLSIATYLNVNSFILFFVMIALMEFTFGIIAPVFETLINHFIPPEDSNERATILSAGSMIRSILMFFLSMPTGGTSGKTTPIFWAIPATFLFFCLCVTTVVMIRHRKPLSEIKKTTEEVLS